MSDAALDLHGLPAPGYIGRASTPSTTSQPMLVNMRDIHDPISFRGGSMRHGSAPLPSEKTCNDMDALTRSFSTSAPVKLDVSDSGLLAHLDHHFEKQSFEYPNWISRWAEDTSSSPTVHQTLFHHYPLTPTSMVSKESGDDASSVASCGNFTLNSVLCQTPMSTTSNLSMFPVAENGTQKKQVRHKLPTAPTSVPSAATAPATTKTMAKRTRSESSDEELESEDEDGFELDEGCEGRSQPKRRRVQRPPASLAKTSEDEYLLRAREAGMTYKEIKIHGCFSKKESTLRGRYRNLTKNKNDRVRKPQWTNNDVSLSWTLALKPLLTFCYRSIYSNSLSETTVLGRLAQPRSHGNKRPTTLPPTVAPITLATQRAVRNGTRSLGIRFKTGMTWLSFPSIFLRFIALFALFVFHFVHGWRYRFWNFDG